MNLGKKVKKKCCLLFYFHNFVLNFFEFLMKVRSRMKEGPYFNLATQ